MKTVIITKDNFEEEVINSSKPVLLDFWAQWCIPCLMISPIIEEIAGETEAVKVGKINVDEEPELVEAFNIMAMPTFIVLKYGEVVSAVSGIKPKSYILNMLNS
jgi:thioredoxin 1